MQLVELVTTSESISRTRSRREKTALLSSCLRALSENEVAVGVAFLSGELRQGRIGLGHATVYGVDAPAAARAELTLFEVDRAFDEIAAISGARSNAARKHALGALLARATSLEQGYLRRLILGELRQGALEGSMHEAIARAFDVSLDAVRRAAMLCGKLAEVAEVARREAEAGLGRFSIRLMTPLAPMLAQSAEAVEDALTRMPHAAFEHKLDGARVQVHRDGANVRVFTRELNEVTARVPELVEAVSALPIHSAIFDGEAIALDGAGRPLPFQVTMRRFGRKLDIERMREQLPLHTLFFDCLYLDGEDLIARPADARIAALHASVSETRRIARLVTSDANAARAFLNEALAAGHEGVMAKDPHATYEAGRRGAGWLKIKPVRTLDLVVIAIEWGNGRRAGKLSNLHLGARDPSSGGFAMVGKTFKGMTDAMLEWQTQRFSELAIGQEQHVVHVEPVQVVEIAFDGVQHSLRYASGVALRFARVKRYRTDKTASAADTIETVRSLLPPL